MPLEHEKGVFDDHDNDMIASMKIRIATGIAFHTVLSMFSANGFTRVRAAQAVFTLR